MSQTLPQQEGPGDAELISAVRGGDVSAYGDLFERHVVAARRLARQLTNPSDADDLVSEAFTKVLHVLKDGGGPDVAFRAYLLTAVRRLHVDKIRAGARLQTTDDLTPFDPGVPFRDTAVEGFENAAAARAFASLPERWQLVLWHTEVEGHKPADIAPLLGMSSNSVSALAYRAREGLRQAFLSSHASEAEDDRCRWTQEHLGGYVRGGLSKRDNAKVEQHLGECRRCMAIYLELTEVNSNLSAILGPLLLGSAGMAYVAAASGTKTGILLLLDRTREGIAAHSGLAAAGAVGAVAATVAIAAAVTVGFDTDRQGGDRGPQAAPPSSTVATPPSDTPSPSVPDRPVRATAKDTVVPPRPTPTDAPAPVDQPRPVATTTPPPATATDEPQPDPTPTATPPPNPTPPASTPPASTPPEPDQEAGQISPPAEPPPAIETPPATDLTLSVTSANGSVNVTTAGFPDADSTATVDVRFTLSSDAQARDLRGRRNARHTSRNCQPLVFGTDLVVTTTCTTRQASPSLSFPDFGVGTYTFTASADGWTDADPSNNVRTWGG